MSIFTCIAYHEGTLFTVWGPCSCGGTLPPNDCPQCQHANKLDAEGKDYEKEYQKYYEIISNPPRGEKRSGKMSVLKKAKEWLHSPEHKEFNVAYLVQAMIKELEKCKCEEYRSMLEDVVSELDLSDGMIEQHGPLGTEPATLVSLVLASKDQEIAMLKAGMKRIEG